MISNKTYLLTLSFILIFVTNISANYFKNPTIRNKYLSYDSLPITKGITKSSNGLGNYNRDLQADLSKSAIIEGTLQKAILVYENDVFKFYRLPIDHMICVIPGNSFKDEMIAIISLPIPNIGSQLTEKMPNAMKPQNWIPIDKTNKR